MLRDNFFVYRAQAQEAMGQFTTRAAGATTQNGPVWLAHIIGD